MILDLYTWMTTGNDSKYIHLQSMVIKGHKSSIEITRGKKLEASQRDPIVLHACSNFHEKLQSTFKLDH